MNIRTFRQKLGNCTQQTATRWLLPMFLVALNACSGTGPTQAEHPKRLRVVVGEIEEVTVDNPKDRTLQLSGSSDDKEIVEVSTKQLASADAQPTSVKPLRQAVFLIKGISTGTSKVVISEQKADEQGPGRPLKTYLVEVVNR